MNILYRVIKYSMFLPVLFLAITLHGRVRTVQTERDFDQQVSKSNLMVALFYDGVNKRNSKVNQEQMKPFFHMYESVSSRKIYDDADVVFTKLNMKNQAIVHSINRYAITESPCFIIFIKGKPVMDAQGKIAQLVGFVSEHQLQEFINFYCMNDIQIMVKEKEQNRKQRLIKAKEESDPYFYPAVYYAPEYDFSWQKPLKYDAEGNEK